MWSFMHEDENMLCPFIERKLEVYRLSGLCKVRVAPTLKIYRIAQDLQKKVKLPSKDALHLACVYHVKSRFFLTWDEELISQIKRLNLEMRVMNPVEYVWKGEKL